MLRREVAVEFRIVRNDFRVAHKRHQVCKRLLRRGRIGHVFVVNVRQMGNIVGNGLAGIDEGDEPVDDLTLFHTRRRDLGQLIVVERKARRFGVEHDDVAVKLAVICAARLLGKRGIALEHIFGRSIRNKAFELRRVLFSHIFDPSSARDALFLRVCR